MNEETTTNETQATDQATETQAAAKPAKAEKPPKRQRMVIYQDDKGNEIARREKGKGRNPKDSRLADPNDETSDVIVPNCTLNADGDPVLPSTLPEHVQVDKIVLDENGNIVSRTAKGRGKPPKGFTKATDGEFAGHWVKVSTPEPEPADEPVAEAEVANEAEEAAAEAIEAATEQAIA